MPTADHPLPACRLSALLLQRKPARGQTKLGRVSNGDQSLVKPSSRGHCRSRVNVTFAQSYALSAAQPAGSRRLRRSASFFFLFFLQDLIIFWGGVVERVCNLGARYGRCSFPYSSSFDSLLRNYLQAKCYS